MYSPLLIFNIHNIQEKFMKKSPIVLRRILLLLLITGLAACAGKDKDEATPDNMTEQLRQEIIKVVADTDRANEAAELAAHLRQIFVDAQVHEKKDIENFRALNVDFDSTDAELNAFFDGINARGNERQRKVLAIHEKMKTLITAEEWDQLDDARKKALETDLKLL